MLPDCFLLFAVWRCRRSVVAADRLGPVLRVDAGLIGGCLGCHFLLTFFFLLFLLCQISLAFLELIIWLNQGDSNIAVRMIER